MTRLPHICFVAPHAYPLLSGDYKAQILGGAELQQVILARALVLRKYQVSMICLDFGQADGVEIDGITIHKSFRPTAGIPVFRFIHPRLTSLWSCLKNADADIYYTRAAGMLTGVVASFALRHGKKTIFSAANNRDFSKNMLGIRFRRDRWIYEWGVRNTDKIVVQNEDQLKICKKNFGRDATIIQNSYSAPGSKSLENADIVLWVSTIREIKRPDRFIDLARLLPDRQFVMIGGEDGDERDLYRRIKASAEKEKNIDFIGFVPFSEVDKYFAMAKVFVNTSDTEGFPNTFLQSWSRSVPTVSFIDCGARSGSRPVGLRVTSTVEMAGTVERLCSDEAEYQEIGQLCARYCREYHSIETVAGKYEDLFREIYSV